MTGDNDREPRRRLNLFPEAILCSCLADLYSSSTPSNSSKYGLWTPSLSFARRFIAGATFEQVVKGRRSIRGYLKKPVPKQLVKEILEMAIRAPTSLNTQPWNFYVVSGDVLNRIRKGNVERNLAGVPHSREFRLGPDYVGPHRERQIGIAKQLFAAMGIERNDKEKRQDW